MKDLNLLSDEVSYDLEGVSYKQFTATLIGANETVDIKQAVADKLNLKTSSDIIKQLQWLGLFDDKKIPMSKGTNADVILDLMKEKMSYKEHEKDMIIVGVNYKDKAPAAQRWLQTKGNPYRFNIFDPDGILGLDLGVTGAPETYVLDHRGFVRFRYQGPLNEMVWQDKFQALIEQLQQEQLAYNGRGSR